MYLFFGTAIEALGYWISC